MEDYNKLSGKIKQLAAMPPERLAEHLTSIHPKLYDAAPNVATHLFSAASRGINYLNSKLPRPAMEFPGEDDYEPSKSQKSDWLGQHEAADDPISILEHVKNGTLTSKHMEALQAVHPDLLQEMQHQVASHADPKALKSLPYSTKLAVSKFLGQPLDGSLLPNVVAQDQATFNQPTQAAAGTSSKGKGSTLGGLSKLSLSKRSETEIQGDESNDD